MVRVGVLGAGGMGNVHARQYRKMPDVELSFFDPNEEKATAYRERWSANLAPSVEALIESVDAIDICLPTDLHLPLALQALEAGKAVFIEKPIAKTLDEARQIMAAAERSGSTVMVGQVVRYFAEFNTANRIIKSGGVGTPAAARTRRGGLAPKGSGDWFMDHTRSGGVIVDLAIHDFDWLRWTFGEVKHLYAKSVGAATDRGPDYALTTLTFENGAVAHVEATWMDPNGFRTTLEVAGSKGLIQHDSRNNAAVRTNAEGKVMVDNSLDPLQDPYYIELRGFVDAVKNGTEPPITAHDGFMALSIALAARESAKTGEVVVPVRS